MGLARGAIVGASLTCAAVVVPSGVGSGTHGRLSRRAAAQADAAALLRLLRDRDLRADLRERGLRRARRFSWRATAERTLAAYQDAHAGR
jgi:glycosyltransferase involved in cell wall biosynthesis